MHIFQMHLPLQKIESDLLFTTVLLLGLLETNAVCTSQPSVRLCAYMFVPCVVVVVVVVVVCFLVSCVLFDRAYAAQLIHS